MHPIRIGLKTPFRSKEIISTNPRPKSVLVYDFFGLVYSFVVLLCVCLVHRPYTIYFILLWYIYCTWHWMALSVLKCHYETTHTLTHSLTHSLTHTLTHTLTLTHSHSFTHSLTQDKPKLFISSFTKSHECSLVVMIALFHRAPLYNTLSISTLDFTAVDRGVQIQVSFARVQGSNPWNI